MGLISKIKDLWSRLKYQWSKNACYNEMEKQGIAIFGMCSGLAGGDKFTDYLQYSCIDCPYFSFPESEEKFK